MAATNINRVVMTGNLTKTPSCARCPAAPRCASCASPATRVARTAPPGVGRTSPTTSTSRCGARRARTPPASSPRAARWRSTGAWSGASGRPRTGTKRQAIDIIADSVQFLGSREDASGGGGFAGNGATPRAETPRRRGGLSARAGRRRDGRRRHPVLGFPAGEPETPTRRTARDPVAKASGRGKPARRREKRGGPGSGRRKPCQHCRDKIEQVDYKDVDRPAAVHLREGQDPLAADHRRLPPPPGADRARGQARAGARAAALRERGRPRRPSPARTGRPRPGALRWPPGTHGPSG